MKLTLILYFSCALTKFIYENVYRCNMGSMVYIVDYDIPEEPASKRVQFYRDLKRLSTYFQGYDYSTLSVLRTHEKEMAEAVYFLVIAYGGNVHMYKAEEVVPSLG